MPLFKTTQDIDAADLRLVHSRPPQHYLPWCIMTDSEGLMLDGETPEEYEALRLELANTHFKAGNVRFSHKGCCPAIDLSDFILEFEGAELLPEDVAPILSGDIKPLLMCWQETTREMELPERRALWEVLRILLT